MALFKYAKTIFRDKDFLKDTRNRFKVVSVSPYSDKKGKLPNGQRLTLKILEDDGTPPTDKNGNPQDNLVDENFDVTVLSCDPMVRKGDYIALENFDQEHSYVINYSVILRFKGLRVLQPQQPKSMGGKSL